jgi:hypothetical protein
VDALRDRGRRAGLPGGVVRRVSNRGELANVGVRLKGVRSGVERLKGVEDGD